MGVAINIRQAYSEIDEFLELLSAEQRNRIPKKLREFFKEEKDENYKKRINPQIPIKDQDLKEETLGIIAALNLQYWCENEEEKQKLKEKYAKNEEAYQKLLKEKFNPDNIFKNRTVNVEKEQENNTQLVVYKDSIIKRVFNKILQFLHLK